VAGAESYRPKASPAKLEYHRRQLDKLLERATNQQFLQMIWAVDALQSGRHEVAASILRFPREAADASISSLHAIHRWELETLLIQFMRIDSHADAEKSLAFDCGQFGSAATLVNRLRKLDDVESALYLGGPKIEIFDEMHRIAQRQFHWQDGYFNRPQMYRYAFIYGQGRSAVYFQKTYGIPISDFLLVGFAMYVNALKAPWRGRTPLFPEIGLTEEVVKAASPLLVISAGRARTLTRDLVTQMTATHGGPIPLAFLPSILRRYPVVHLTDDAPEVIAPVPEMLIIRITAGLYYDVIGGGQELLNEANDRFEQYCARSLGAYMKRFEVIRAYRFEPKKGAAVDTPDVLVKDGGTLALVAECKATKLTYLAQFADDPFKVASKQYLQIANGVFQLWRFFSHVRRGLLNEPVTPDTAAMIITLDSFLVMSRKLKDQILAEANRLADAQGEIIEQDRRQVVISSVQSLESVLSTATEDEFLTAFKAAKEEKYMGWQLREIARSERKGGANFEQKKYPFTLDEILPWWSQMANSRTSG